MQCFTKFAMSGLTALSISLAPVPAFAGPDGEDIAKALAGLAVIGLIATAAKDRRSKNSSSRTFTTVDPFSTIEGSRAPRAVEGRIIRPNQRVQRARGFRQAALPDRCIRLLSTNRGDRSIYSARCLQRHYVYYNQLPRDCRFQVHGNSRPHIVFGTRCLRRDGWQVARY
ncbi:MAG: hypothetical protein AAF222_03045 [Pseudomonadota bacterium]